MERRRQWKAANPRRDVLSRRAAQSRYKASHREEFKIKARKEAAAASAKLTDGFVRQALRAKGRFPLTAKDIPHELVSLKREQLTLLRLAEKMKQAAIQSMEKS